jgi:hypothetical protein
MKNSLCTSTFVFVVALLIDAQMGAAWALHIGNAAQLNERRTPMDNEGYLEFQANPVFGRFGEEWTGWVDVRHPAMDGTTQTFDPFDRSNRFVNVKTITVNDNAGTAAAPNIPRDFDYASKIWAQTGISIVRQRDPGNETMRLDGTNGAPNIPWPIDQAGQDDAMKGVAAVRAANPTVNLWYVDRYTPALNGLTSPPNPYGGNTPRNDGIGMANSAQDSTLGHELGHMILNGDNAIHRNAPNFQQTPGNNLTFSEIGPVGGRYTFAPDQITTAFTPPAAGNQNSNNAGLVQQNAEAQTHTYGNRVDWDFVVDHTALESITNADNHLGLDSLFFGIDNGQGPANQAGHDHAGLGDFRHPGNFAATAFNRVDIFSSSLRYSDFDQNAAGGQSLREGALDYRVFFRGAGGAQAEGVPLTIFEPGWTTSTNVDNYLTRWTSPIDATGLFVFANSQDSHDGIAQIDAVIASNSLNRYRQWGGWGTGQYRPGGGGGSLGEISVITDEGKKKAYTHLGSQAIPTAGGWLYIDHLKNTGQVTIGPDPNGVGNNPDNHADYWKAEHPTHQGLHHENFNPPAFLFDNNYAQVGPGFDAVNHIDNAGNIQIANPAGPNGHNYFWHGLGDGVNWGVGETILLGFFDQHGPGLAPWGGKVVGSEGSGFFDGFEEMTLFPSLIGPKDYGDAPDSYRTLLVSDGPRYDEGDFQRLGHDWDAEIDGQPTLLANGDDLSLLGGVPFALDDEDGVVFGDSWVDIVIDIGRPGLNDYSLRAWWDINENGMFDHLAELFIDQILNLDIGSYLYHFDLGFNPKDYYSRFRLTWLDDPLGLIGGVSRMTDITPHGEFLSADGLSHGEAEDYVPEPGTFALVAAGAFSFCFNLRRKPA